MFRTCLYAVRVFLGKRRSPMMMWESSYFIGALLIKCSRSTERGSDMPADGPLLLCRLYAASHPPLSFSSTPASVRFHNCPNSSQSPTPQWMRPGALVLLHRLCLLSKLLSPPPSRGGRQDTPLPPALLRARLPPHQPASSSPGLVLDLLQARKRCLLPHPPKAPPPSPRPLGRVTCDQRQLEASRDRQTLVQAPPPPSPGEWHADV